MSMSLSPGPPAAARNDGIVMEDREGPVRLTYAAFPSFRRRTECLRP